MTSRTRQLLSTLLPLALRTLPCVAVACVPMRSEEPEAQAEFGVFFGGQLQQRQELAFELNPARLQPGFRLRLESPLPQASVLRWELSKPSPPTGPHKITVPERRRTELGSAELAKGTKSFDQPLAILPGDNLGLWNIRVVLGETVLLDRAFTVYDARRRRKARSFRRDGGL